jgi:hypothetical protein
VITFDYFKLLDASFDPRLGFWLMLVLRRISREAARRAVSTPGCPTRTRRRRPLAA